MVAELRDGSTVILFRKPDGTIDEVIQVADKRR